eukprot:CAMPEP_0206183648 /NCGR_PEP_ID=MMETSP0166-20121206/757_1 /ASSEMBLY_ACC=CAM_ASM_000260 /TAXON_ID=95228 /ORGANISM="Vannella robusta, Strain DIVA3 518/3/11/1/6" /LENGTH=1012 /DNA_ID=CAMNT_0053598531 /DNA_START=97 /DNA_END=3132 /DNA_ORIENTATION=-
MQQYCDVLDDIVLHVLPQIHSPDVLNILSSYTSDVNAMIDSRLENTEAMNSGTADSASVKKKTRKKASHTSSHNKKRKKKRKAQETEANVTESSISPRSELDADTDSKDDSKQENDAIKGNRVRSTEIPSMKGDELSTQGPHSPLLDSSGSNNIHGVYKESELIDICNQMQDNDSGVPLKTKKSKLNHASACFSASEAISWFQTCLSLSKDNSIALGQQLLDEGLIIAQSSTSHCFKDKNNHFYKFPKDKTLERVCVDKKNTDIGGMETNSAITVSRKRSRSVEHTESGFLLSQKKNTGSLAKTQLIPKDYRKEFLLRRATETMALADIFTFGFIVSKTVNSFVNPTGDNNASRSSENLNTSMEKQGSVRSKLVRTSMLFAKTKKSERNQLPDREHHRAAIAEFEKFLILAQSFQPLATSTPNSIEDSETHSDNVWRIIFFSVFGTQRESKIKYILTQENIHAMNQALTHYLTFSDSSFQKKYLATATELVEFFSSCTMDPYSILIGHLPSRRVVTRILHEKLSNPLHCNAVPGSLVVVKKKVKNDTSEGESCSYIYGRCMYKVDGQTQVSTTVYSNQRKTLSVSGSDCYDLPNDLREEINRASEWDIFGLEKFLDNPVDELSRNLMFVDTEKVIRKYLAVQGIDLSVMSRAIIQDVTLADVYELHRGNEVCLSIIENMPNELVTDVKEVIEQKIQEFFDNIPREKLFLPTLAARRAELPQIYSQAIPAIARQLAGNCSGCLDQLKLDRRDLLSGKTKNELVEWWLTEIEKQTNELLLSFAYKFDTLPDNYIQEPPSDMKLVSANLNALSEAKESTQLQTLIGSLKELIYPHIDGFLTNAKAVLSAQLGFDLRSFDVAAVTQLFKEKEEELRQNDESLVEWIEDSIEDIRYLDEMRKLEDPEYAASNSNPHIVPVSGLVYGVFARLENEHKTANELWAHLAQSGDSDVTPVVQTKQIREALRAKNFKLVETLLDRVDSTNDKYFDVNEKDPKTGSTILHDCIYLSQFKLAQK